MHHKLTGPEKLPQSGAKPYKLVIFLHGVGADGADLIELADEFSDTLKNAVFISPNAPFAYDMFPAGYQWFSLVNRDEDILYEGVKKALPILKHYIDENLAKYDLSYKDLVLIGFSQGTMMALQLSLRLDQPCLAVIGFSGALIKSAELKLEIKSKPPILLVHGSEDQVISIESHVKAAKDLENMDLEVEDHIIDRLGHGISLEGIELANEFIKNRLK